MWTWGRIVAECLGGSGLIADGDEVAVEAFNRIDAILGPEWIERYRAAHGGSDRRGLVITMNLVILGKELANIDGVRGSAEIIRKLRELRTDPIAELDAIALVMVGSDDLRLECEPTIPVPGREARKADFRIANGDEQCVYVEVTQPNTSEAEKSIALATAEISTVVESIDGSYATEVFFHRSPTPEELLAVRPLVEEVCRSGQATERHLPDELGVIYAGHTAPHAAVVGDHHGRPYTPRIVRVTFVGRDIAKRQLKVSVPSMDHRAAQYLEDESGQLPDDSPGVIMIDTRRATGAMKGWAPMLHDQLRLDMYSNVSAVCLFSSSLVDTERGEDQRITTLVVTNPGAAHQLPAWMDTCLRRYESTA